MSKALAAGSGVLSLAAVLLALWTAAENRALRRQLEDERILAPRDGAPACRLIGVTEFVGSGWQTPAGN